jgi:hypothetical protein
MIRPGRRNVIKLSVYCSCTCELSAENSTRLAAILCQIFSRHRSFIDHIVLYVWETQKPLRNLREASKPTTLLKLAYRLLKEQFDASRLMGLGRYFLVSFIQLRTV